MLAMSDASWVSTFQTFWLITFLTGWKDKAEPTTHTRGGWGEASAPGKFQHALGRKAHRKRCPWAQRWWHCLPQHRPCVLELSKISSVLNTQRRESRACRVPAPHSCSCKWPPYTEAGCLPGDQQCCVLLPTQSSSPNMGESLPSQDATLAQIALL